MTRQSQDESTESTEESTLDPQLVQETARMLRCLGHPVRLRILDLLERESELTVTEIYEALGLEQAVCSQHLSLMRDKGILGHRKEGVNVFYSVGESRALKVLACLRGSQAAVGA